jgi:pimeloyl-ACP methyl ester carboxylesterase
VKPANILLDGEGTPFLADFGIARFADEPAPKEAGQVLGTPAYMAPEQKRGEPTTKADQFSLAKTLLVMLGGATRLKPADAIECLPSQYEALTPVLRRALSDDPEARYPDVAALALALRGIDVKDTKTTTRLAPIIRDSSTFEWVSGHHRMQRFGEHIVRVDYKLSDLVELGLLEPAKVEAFYAATGCADYAWSLYARDEHLGPIDEPAALARARQSVVLLHGLFTNRELWQDVAVGIARDNARMVALVPDVGGFGESKLGRKLPPKALHPAGLVRTMKAWLTLIGVDDTPTAVVGHSYSAAALMCARESELGEGVHRICITPAFFFFSWVLRMRARFDAILAGIAFAMPRSVAWRIARFFFRREPSLAQTDIRVRDAMARSAVELGGNRVARLFWLLAGARPAPAEELERCIVVTTPNDPLVTAEHAEKSIATAGVPESQWYRLVYGGHFPQLLDDDHPEWGARNVHELVSLVDGVLDRAPSTTGKKSSKKSTAETASNSEDETALLTR